MKKQLRYILITLIVAAVIGLGVLAAVLFIPDAPDDTASTIPSQKVLLYEKPSSDLEKLTVTNQYGSYEVTQKESGNFHIAELDSYVVDITYIESLVKSYTALSAKKLIAENPEDISIYGFNEPIATAKLEYPDETITVVIGNAEPTTNGYYCKLEGSNSVYLLTSGIGGRLLSSKLSYVDTVITPSYDTNEGFTVDKLVLSGSVRDKEIVVVSNPDVSDNDEYSDIFGYEIISPASAPFDIVKGSDYLTSFFVIAGDSVVELSPDEETLKEYGFDNPYSVASIESSVADFTVTVGKKDGEYCYVMNDTQDVIYRCLVSSLQWIDTQYQDIVSSMFLVPHIHLVSSVDIVTAAKQYTFNIDYNKDNNTIFVKHGDKDVNTENFQSLYQVLVSCYLENYTTDRSDAEPYMTLTYHFREGGEEKLELYTSPSDSRQALIKYNGNWTDFSVRMVYVDKVIADCQKLLRGETISTTW